MFQGRSTNKERNFVVEKTSPPPKQKSTKNPKQTIFYSEPSIFTISSVLYACMTKFLNCLSVSILFHLSFCTCFLIRITVQLLENFLQSSLCIRKRTRKHLFFRDFGIVLQYQKKSFSKTRVVEADDSSCSRPNLLCMKRSIAPILVHLINELTSHSAYFENSM